MIEPKMPVRGLLIQLSEKYFTISKCKNIGQINRHLLGKEIAYLYRLFLTNSTLLND